MSEGKTRFLDNLLCEGISSSVGACSAGVAFAGVCRGMVVWVSAASLFGQFDLRGCFFKCKCKWCWCGLCRCLQGYAVWVPLFGQSDS